MHKKLSRTDRRGFTLNELLVVIAIIGILSGIVFASLGPARESSKNAKITSDIGQYVTTIHLLKEKNGEYPNPGNTTTYCLSEEGAQPCSSSSRSLALNAILKSALGTLPSSTDKINNNQQWGYTYKCLSIASSKCVKYQLRWALYGKNSDCSPGTQIASNIGDPFTHCEYTR